MENMIKRFFYFLGIIFVFAVSGCNNENIERPGSFGSLDNSLSNPERINKFIIDGVRTYYLWESETDWSKYDDREKLAVYSDHGKLFENFVHKDDHWSSLTDDINGLTEQVDNVSKTFGYYLRIYRNPFTMNNEAIAVVLYTVPGSPAADKGLKRGDIIVEVNGGKITLDNYNVLVNASSLTLKCGVLNNESKTITVLPETKAITAVKMYKDPVSAYKVIEEKGHKIGYLCYTGYQEKSENDLVRIFSEFKSAGVSYVVLDLRYNTGGYARTAKMLSSILVPKSVVDSKGVYLEHYYNNLYAAYLKDRGGELNEHFVDTLPVNMDLKHLYILTGKNTASASEATIVGLKPYLNVTLIGDTTAGKYCGGILLSPSALYGEKYESYYSGFSNWGMYIMVYRFANINGISSFTGGIIPDIPANEGSFDLKPFGDKNDPLLGRALAHILNEEYIETRSSGEMFEPFISLPDMKSPVDGMLDSSKKIIVCK